MDPNATPPWRALEAPAVSGEPPPAAASASGAPGTAPRTPGATIGVPADAIRWAGAGLGVVACLLVAAWLALGSGAGAAVSIEPAASGLAAAGSAPPVAASPGIVVVEIVGAVARPGVYRLPAGSRVADLVAAAGGYGPRVDTSRVTDDLDLVAALADGSSVRVPARGDPPVSRSPAVGGGTSGTPGGPIDLNTATAEQLDTLPGIGPVTAAKILAARDEAPFAAVDELRSRGVLGEKTFERIRDLVTVR